MRPTIIALKGLSKIIIIIIIALKAKVREEKRNISEIELPKKKKNLAKNNLLKLI